MKIKFSLLTLISKLKGPRIRFVWRVLSVMVVFAVIPGAIVLGALRLGSTLLQTPSAFPEIPQAHSSGKASMSNGSSGNTGHAGSSSGSNPSPAPSSGGGSSGNGGGNGNGRGSGENCGSSSMGRTKNPDGSYTFSLLHVSGGHVLDANGCTVYLRGFNTAGTEFGNAKGGMSQQTLAFFQQQFNTNIWRLSINVTWWTENSYVPDAGMYYQDWIRQVISWMKANGNYVELNRVNQYPDSQSPPYKTLYPPCGATITTCPSQNEGSGSNPWQNNPHWLDVTTAFWKSITPLYSSDPAIIYNIWNEMPNVTDHQLWRAAEETLIQTVRTISPKALIMLGGPDYNRGIQPLTSGEVADFTEPNLIFDYHVYSNYTSAWQNNAAFLRNDYSQWVTPHNHMSMIGEWGHQTNSQAYQNTLVQFAKDTASPLIYYDSWDVQSNGQLNANGKMVQQGFASLPT